MNGRKKLLCVFFLAFFLFCYTSVNASAVDSSGSGNNPAAGSPTTSQSGKNEQSGQTSQPGDKPTDTKPASSPSSPSSAAVASSQAPSSKAPPPASSKPRKHHYAASSFVSSMPESIPDFTSSEESSSGVISLPDAGVVSENDPFASASSGTPSKLMTRAGILAWVCIGLGILVVLIVILSNRRPPRGPGRSRYHRPKQSGKRLLNDRYYRGLKRY